MNAICMYSCIIIDVFLMVNKLFDNSGIPFDTQEPSIDNCASIGNKTKRALLWPQTHSAALRHSKAAEHLQLANPR